MNYDVVRARLERRSIPEPNTGCQLWVGGAHPFGYGHVAVGGHKIMLAHRASYAVNVGPIPDRLMVLHKCDTPACINPQHLFLGTHKDNGLDMSRKGRGNFNKATREQRSEWAKRGAITMGPEERHQRALDITKGWTPERRRARGAGNGTRVVKLGVGIHAAAPEAREAWRVQGVAAAAARSPEDRRACALKAWATRKTRAYEPMSAEKKRERALRGVATRRANKAKSGN